MEQIQAIQEFQGKYRWLSNFEVIQPFGILWQGRRWPSVENAYQFAKWILAVAKPGNPVYLIDSLDLILSNPDVGAEALKFRDATPGQSKKLGRFSMAKPQIEAWNQVRDEIMFTLLQRKFCHPMYADLLIKTGNAKLIEGNYWHDTYWGVCNGNCYRGPHEPTGENRLGDMLMQVRGALQSK